MKVAVWLVPEGSQKCVVGELGTGKQTGVWLKKGWTLEQRYPVTDGGDDLIVASMSPSTSGAIFIPIWRVLEIVEIMEPEQPKEGETGGDEQASAGA